MAVGDRPIVQALGPGITEANPAWSDRRMPRAVMPLSDHLEVGTEPRSGTVTTPPPPTRQMVVIHLSTRQPHNTSLREVKRTFQYKSEAPRPCFLAYFRRHGILESHPIGRRCNASASMRCHGCKPVNCSYMVRATQ